MKRAYGAFGPLLRLPAGWMGRGAFFCRRSSIPNSLLRHGPVRVASNGHFLQHADGTPFFWLGDTVWAGPALSTPKDWADYLDDRKSKHFSVIQFNALCPWRACPADAEGQTAFSGTRRIRINPDYFRRLDARIDAINRQGLLAAPVLIWANKLDDPGNALAEEDIIRLLRYQVARYEGNYVVWILAGDNSYAGAGAEKWQRIGSAVFGQQSYHAPVTTHPTGLNWPWRNWRDETWLNVLGYQSGHGDDALTLQWLHSGPATQHWQRSPIRPIINLEPPYEDHRAYQLRRPHSAFTVRRAIYWSLLSTPTAGVTYGAHGLWSWQTQSGQEPRDHPGTGPARSWREALNLPGSMHMKYLAELFASVSWWQLRPRPDLVVQPSLVEPARYIAAAWSEQGDLALIYLPMGGEVRLRPGMLRGGLDVHWFDPRTGKKLSVRDGDNHRYLAPDDQDWVLVSTTEKISHGSTRKNHGRKKETLSFSSVVLPR